MARLRHHPPTDPAVADWLGSTDGWSISQGPTPHEARPDFEGSDLDAVQAAVLARMGVTEAELRGACSDAGTRRVTRGTNRHLVVLPPAILAHLGAEAGDALEFSALPDGRVGIRRAAPVDVPAIRRRIHEAGVSSGLLSRLFDLPRETVRRIVKGEA